MSGRNVCLAQHLNHFVESQVQGGRNLNASEADTAGRGRQTDRRHQRLRGRGSPNEVFSKAGGAVINN